jgi:hypothetical protein
MEMRDSTGSERMLPDHLFEKATVTPEQIINHLFPNCDHSEEDKKLLYKWRFWWEPTVKIDWVTSYDTIRLCRYLEEEYRLCKSRNVTPEQTVHYCIDAVKRWKIEMEHKYGKDSGMLFVPIDEFYARREVN